MRKRKMNIFAWNITNTFLFKKIKYEVIFVSKLFIKKFFNKLTLITIKSMKEIKIKKNKKKI